MKIGLYNKRGTWVPFRTKRATTLLIGKPGTGKSETLRRLALNDIYANRSVVYFGCASIINYIPKERFKDVVLFEPTRFPFRFNILHSSPILVLQAIKALWPTDIATVRIDSYIGAGLLTLHRKKATLFDIIKLLSDKDYRERMKDTLTDFWDRFDTMSLKEQRDKTESSISRLQSFTFEPHVRDCLSTKDNALTFKDKIVIVSLNVSELGAENARLLGALILAHLAHENPKTTLYLDGFVPGTALIMERCPSLPVFLAVHSLTELGKERDAVLGAASQVIAFRTTKRDADELEPEFYLDTLSHLHTQPDYQAYITRGFGSVLLHMPLHTYPKTKQAERITNYSRKHYGG